MLCLLAVVANAQPPGDIAIDQPPERITLSGGFGVWSLLSAPGELISVQRERYSGSWRLETSSSADFHWSFLRTRYDFLEERLGDCRLHLSDNDERGVVGLTLPLASRRLLLETASTVVRRSGQSVVFYKARMMGNPVDFAIFSVSAGRDGERFNLDGVYFGESIPLALTTDRFTTSVSGAVRITGFLSIKSAFEDMVFDSSRTTNATRYVTQVLGNVEWRHYGIVFGDSHRQFLEIVAGTAHGRGRLNLFAGNTRFGQIAELNGDCAWWRLSGGLPSSRHEWKASFSRWHASGEMAGHVEGWPFTATLVDLLGLRSNFKAKADVVLWLAQGSGRFALPKKIALHSAVDIFRIYPQLSWMDWRPSYYLFGMTDIHRYEDRYRRVDAGRAQLDLTVPIGRFMLEYSISQLFPIKLVKEKKENGASDGTGGGASSLPGASTSSRSDGGRRQMLRLTCHF